MSLTFKESSHRYRLDGKAVKSVTGILGGGIPKPALAYWAANEAARSATEWAGNLSGGEPADALWALDSFDADSMYEQWRKAPWQKRDQAAVRGTAVHALAEQLVHGLDVDVPDELVPYVDGYARFLDAWEIEPILTERSVAHRGLWFAGRFDLIASTPFLHDGQPIETDLKTSNKVYADTAIQTAAYARAEFYVDDDDPDTEKPLPDVAATYVLHVTADGTRMFELCTDRAAIDAAFDVFKAAYVVHTRWNPKDLKEVTR